MVQIPGSQFLMGTTFEEASHVQAAYVRYRGEEFGGFWREGPPHTVTVPKFYMGAFEISQAQWRAVSALPKVSIDLPSDPSRYKGGDRPVEDITWNEAVEFCERLSLAKGRKYRPPTEAEWEYACRAGTTTQFHFGDSITTEFANYNGVYPYGAVGWGTNPDETTPVGSFGAPNAFGLYDMHGNVGELCIDPWHATYEGAPSDGSAWIVNGESDVHVVRGGAFLTTPVDIRAASRSYHPALLRWYYTGLRIVAVPRIP
jgi:formylglycine-generating enzyme required for sulfatase activity